MVDLSDDINALAEEFRQCQPILLALGDETRQHIILEMMEMEDWQGVRVGTITQKTHLSRPAVSHHIQILKGAGILKENQDLVYHLFDSISRERFERWIFESSGDIFYRLVCRETEGAKVPEELLRSVAEYNSYSLLGFSLKFLWKRMEVDIDQSVDRISALFKGNIRWAIETHGRTK